MKTIYYITHLLLFWLMFFSSFSQDTHHVFLNGQWKDNSLPSTTDGSVYNDVIGFEWNGEKYAAAGSTVGTHFIKINGSQLTETDRVNGKYFSSLITNRDVFFYDHYVYAICDHGTSSLQIIDISYLPDSVSVVYDSDSLVMKAHSIFIDTATAKMYICGPENLSGNRAMDIFSLADPENPVYLSTFSQVQYVHDIYVRNDTAFMNCAYEGVWVADFSNAAFPVVFGSLNSYPDMGYNHSGWLSENGKTYVFTDETAGKRIKVCDASDISDLQVKSLFNSSGDNNTIAHNVILKDNYVYVSHYYDGLQIFNVSDVSSPWKAGWYDTHTSDENLMSGAWGIFVFNDNTILVSDRQEGLFSFRFDFPPVINTEMDCGIYPNPVSESGYLYINNTRDFSYEFYVYDVNGKKILEEKNLIDHYYRINTVSMADGIYFYHLKGKDNTAGFYGKFVVKNQN
ncbi:MAG: choice-of-anchor B family protein [Bacteroidota bacterium]